MIFGWGNGGWGGFGGNGANGNQFTDAALQRGFDTQTMIGKLDGITQGISTLGYDQLAQMNNLGMAVSAGFNGVARDMCTGFANVTAGINENRFAAQQNACSIERAIDNSRFDTQAGFNALGSQLASCCCDLGRQIERGFCDVNYNMATNTNALAVQMANSTRDIIDSQKSGTQAILSYLCDRQIADLQAENQALRLSASQAQQNAAIGAMISASEATILRRTGAECPTAAYVVQPPTPVNFPTNCCGNFVGWNNGYGYSNNGCGCGCNNGCGCN